MEFRTAKIEDWPKIKELHLAVSKQKTGIARWEDEINDAYVKRFMAKALEEGLMIIAEDPDGSGKIIGEIHASKSKVRVFCHLMTDLTILVHPEFQGIKIGRTLFTIFLEEIVTNRPDIGKVELFTRESNQRAISLYQSLGFVIEGRLEMRIKTPEGTYEADLAMGWQNPSFDFDEDFFDNGLKSEPEGD
jgi:ribosomal protein S18 acetylase RimI-like enzyme